MNSYHGNAFSIPVIRESLDYQSSWFEQFPGFMNTYQLNGDLASTAIYVSMVSFATCTRYNYYDNTLGLSSGLNNFVYMRKVTYVMFPLICKFVGLCLVRHTTIRDFLFMMHRGGGGGSVTSHSHNTFHSQIIAIFCEISSAILNGVIRLTRLFAAIGRQRNHIGILRGRRCACWWERC